MKARLLSAVLAAVFAAAALSLSGCGQKGPLVLPSKQGPAGGAQAPAPGGNPRGAGGNGSDGGAGGNSGAGGSGGADRNGGADRGAGGGAGSPDGGAAQ